MAVLDPIETYLSGEDFVQMSEFPRVRNLEARRAQWYVTRAHLRIRGYEPFQAHDAESELGLAMAIEMQLAVFLIAERIALANPITPMAAGGISSESIGHSTISRAPGGGNSGRSVESEIIPPEAEDILTRWQVVSSDVDEFAVERTRVFDGPSGVNAEDTSEQVFIDNDNTTLAPQLTDRRYSI